MLHEATKQPRPGTELLARPIFPKLSTRMLQSELFLDSDLTLLKEPASATLYELKVSHIFRIHNLVELYDVKGLETSAAIAAHSLDPVEVYGKASFLRKRGALQR
jgi:hypothetical protein